MCNQITKSGEKCKLENNKDYCNIHVQNYNRHLFTINHEYNATLRGYNKYYKTIADKIVKYIKINLKYIIFYHILHLMIMNYTH